MKQQTLHVKAKHHSINNFLTGTSFTADKQRAITLNFVG